MTAGAFAGIAVSFHTIRIILPGISQTENLIGAYGHVPD